MCGTFAGGSGYRDFMTQTSEECPRADVVASEHGRLTIPAPLRRAAGIEPGAHLVVYVEDGRVIVETRELLAARIKRDIHAAWSDGSGSVADELIADRRAEAARQTPREGIHRPLVSE